MQITRFQVIEGSSATLLDQIVDQSGAYPAPATVSDITAFVYDLSTGALIKSTSFAATSVMTSAPAVTNGWNRDRIGANSVIVLDGTNFPAGDVSYRIEVRYTVSGGYIGWSIFEGQCVAIYS